MRLATLTVLLLALTAVHARSHDDDCDDDVHPHPPSPRPPSPHPIERKVYGEFINVFTFGPSLPIVQPGGSVIFSAATVPPSQVQYVQSPVSGLIVPPGVYNVAWVLNPSLNASITLQVNGQTPMSIPLSSATAPYPYTQVVSTGLVDMEVFVVAPLPSNFLSLVNTGSELFTVGTLPNTAIGPQGVNAHIRVQRIATL